MPTKSPVTKVQIEVKRGHRTTYELTAAKVRALETTTQDGKLSDAVAFATARSLTSQKLFAQRGAEWFITPLGRQVRRAARLKRAVGNIGG